MFSTISRKLKGNYRSKEYIQLLTPRAFDDFLANEVFDTSVKVTRVHVVPQMKSVFEGEMNTHTKGIGHGGWRPGHILKRQGAKALTRIEKENPEEYARLMSSNSLVVSDASAQYLLEDFEVLSAMCRGHDGKNPNHVICFVFNRLTGHSTVQYKHFDFEDAWRPTMRYDPGMQEWVNDDNVTYSFFKEDADFGKLMEAVPRVTVTPKPADISVIDELSKCRSTMANFSAAILQEWVEYFALIEKIRQDPVPTMAYTSPKAFAELAEPTKQGLVQVEKRRTNLRLTSAVGVQNRETLVASNRAAASAWSQNQESMRSTPRIQRVPIDELNEGENKQCGFRFGTHTTSHPSFSFSFWNGFMVVQHAAQNRTSARQTELI